MSPSWFIRCSSRALRSRFSRSWRTYLRMMSSSILSRRSRYSSILARKAEPDFELFELLAQFLDLGFDLVEAERAGQCAGEIIFLDRALDALHADCASRFAHHLLELAVIVLQELLGQFGEFLAMLLQHLLDFIEELLELLVATSRARPERPCSRP